jgi:hypothetical protein
MDAAAGETVIDNNTTEFTVRVDVPLIPLADAVMIAVPGATAYAIPVSSMVARDGSLEVQVAVAVKSFFVESL